MALPSLASLRELERRLGGSITDASERDRASALLSDASTLVRHEAGRTWVDADGNLIDVPDIVVTIVLASAKRAWFNPSEATSVQLGATSVRYGDVWLSNVERERIKAAVRGPVTVEMSHGYGFEGTEHIYVPVDHTGLGIANGDQFPFGT